MEYIKKTIGFWVVTACYFCFRCALFPFATSTAQQPSFGLPLLAQIKSHIYMLVTTVIAEFGNFSCISSDFHVLKGVVFAGLMCLITWLFYTNKNKKVLMWGLLVLPVCMWPIIRFYRPRHIYCALVLFVVWLLILLGADDKNKKMGLSIYFFGYAILVLNIFLVCSGLKVRERISHGNIIIVQDLLNNQATSGHALCFIGLPKKFYNSSLAPTIRFLRSDDLSVYYDPATFVDSDEPFQKIKISPILHGYKLTLEDTHGAFIDFRQLRCSDPVFANSSFIMGAILKHACNNNGVYDMSYVFDEKYLKQDILFIAWDYDHARFVMLPPPEGDGPQGFLFAKKMKPFRL